MNSPGAAPVVLMVAPDAGVGVPNVIELTLGLGAVVMSELPHAADVNATPTRITSEAHRICGAYAASVGWVRRLSPSPHLKSDLRDRSQIPSHPRHPNHHEATCLVGSPLPSWLHPIGDSCNRQGPTLRHRIPRIGVPVDSRTGHRRQ